MSLLNLSVKHGTSLAEAQQRMQAAVDEAQAKFAGAISQTNWSPDRKSVTLHGPGVVVELKVDAEQVHATADMPLLGILAGGLGRSGLGKGLTDGIRGLLSRHFPPGLPNR
jgi:hypothetical protein